MNRLLLSFLVCCLCVYGQAAATATITSGQSESSPVRVEVRGERMAYTHAAIIMPSAWTAARIAFRASLDGTAWHDVYDPDGTRVTVAAAAGRWIELPMSAVWAAKYLRLVSVDAGGAPVVQTADRAIIVVMR